MIFLILVGGLILRLISLNQSLWLDEATSAAVARMPLTDIFTKFLPGDFHPPLYYLVLKYWSSIFGFSEIALRIPSIVFGLGSVYIIYLIGRELINKNAGFIAAGLMATSGLAIYYSQEARMYSMATFLVTLLVFSFVKTVKRDRVGDWAVFSLIIVAVAFTDYVSILIFPVFWIYAFIKIKKNSWWKKFITSHIILGILLLLWYPIFIRQLGSGLIIGTTSPLWYKILGSISLKNFALIPVKFIMGRISLNPQWFYGLVVASSASLFGFLLYKAKNNLLLLLWLIVPTILGVMLSLKIPTLSYFRFLFCLPAFYLLVSSGIEKLGKYKTLVILIVICFNLITSFYSLLDPKFQREDWRGAAKAIGTDKIIFPADSQKEALTYYGKGEQITTLSGLSKNDSEVWLSRYVWEIFDPKDATRLELQQLGYNKTQESNFGGVVLWKYKR